MNVEELEKFTVYDCEAETVLEVLEALADYTNKIPYRDHKGSWQGLNRPTMSEEGMRATVENLIDIVVPEIENTISEVEAETNEHFTEVNLKIDKNKELINSINVNSSNVSFKMISHRGYTLRAPENSIPAFELAANKGFWGVECDISVTSDGEFILMHDDTVDRTTNGTGKVSELTLEQIKALVIDYGNCITNYPNLKVPTLDEFLYICRRYNVVPIIEIKEMSANLVDKFLSKLTKWSLIDKAIIISTNIDIISSLRTKNSTIKLQPLLELNEDNLNFVASLGKNTGIDTNQAYVTEELINLAHTMGIEVNAWTVNDNRRTSFSNWGIDYITTDVFFDSYSINYKANNPSTKYTPANIITNIRTCETYGGIGAVWSETYAFSEQNVNRAVALNKFFKPPTKFIIKCPTGFKMTLRGYSASNTMVYDLGWLSDGEILMDQYPNAVYFTPYFATSDDRIFNEDDIINLINNVSILLC